MKPGSYEAQNFGCTCPQQYLRGASIISDDCPLHGPPLHQRVEALRMKLARPKLTPHAGSNELWPNVDRDWIIEQLDAALKGEASNEGDYHIDGGKGK